jgi:hypothetical protein
MIWITQSYIERIYKIDKDLAFWFYPMCIVQPSNKETFKGAKKERLSLFKVKTQTMHKGS